MTVVHEESRTFKGNWQPPCTVPLVSSQPWKPLLLDMESLRKLGVTMVVCLTRRNSPFWGVQQVLSRHFPQSNQLTHGGISLDKKVAFEKLTCTYSALLRSGTTPLHWCGLSPKELLMGRKLRATLSRLIYYSNSLSLTGLTLYRTSLCRGFQFLRNCILSADIAFEMLYTCIKQQWKMKGLSALHIECAFNAHRLRPHCRREKPNRIECALSQYTFGGGLKVDWKWIEMEC